LTHCRAACTSVGQPEIAMMSYNLVLAEDASLGAGRFREVKTESRYERIVKNRIRSFGYTILGRIRACANLICGAEPSFSPAVAIRPVQAGASMSKWLKRRLAFSLSCPLVIMGAQGGYAYADLPTTAVAQTPPIAGLASPHPKDAALQLEIIDRAQCVAQKSALGRRVLEPMRFSTERRLGANDPMIGKVHIRWIVSGLPDAGGTVRYIGPMARGYAGSPFWRHPVSVRVQVVANETVVK
jgi:hypothetical protein